MRYLKRLARRYPMQTFHFLFNAGVFTWLQTTGTMIAYRLGLSGDGIWIYIPNWVKTLTSDSIQSIQILYGASGIVSVVDRLETTFSTSLVLVPLKPSST